MGFRELTMDDMKDKLTTTGDIFDVLVTVVGVAKEIYDEERKKIETLPPKKKPLICRERTMVTPAAPRVPHHAASSSSAAPRSPHHACSSSSASKKRKRNGEKKRNNGVNKSNNVGGPPAKKKVSNGPKTPPPLPEEVRRAIEEAARGRRSFSPPRLVIQKGLHNTDLSTTHNRLSMPMSMIRSDFLKEEEKRYLRRYEGSNKKFKEVMVIEPSLAISTAKICRWDMPKNDGGKMSSAYVINGTWNDVARRNKLEYAMIVQLWAFRLDQDLCFALVCLPEPEPDEEQQAAD